MIKFFKRHQYISLAVGALVVAVVGGVCGGTIVQSINKNSCTSGMYYRSHSPGYHGSLHWN